METARCASTKRKWPACAGRCSQTNLFVRRRLLLGILVPRGARLHSNLVVHRFVCGLFSDLFGSCFVGFAADDAGEFQAAIVSDARGYLSVGRQLPVERLLYLSRRCTG